LSLWYSPMENEEPQEELELIIVENIPEKEEIVYIEPEVLDKILKEKKPDYGTN